MVSPVKYKQRQKALIQGKTQIGLYIGDFRDVYGNFNVHTIGTDRLTTVGHRWPPRKGDERDVGGPFAVHSENSGAQGTEVNWRQPLSEGSSLHYFLEGKLLPEAGITPPVGLVPSANAMRAAGTTGFNKTIPTKPISDVAQFLGELKELPTRGELRIMKDRAWNFRHRAREFGSDYLNLQFGWFPFIRDILSIVDTTINFDTHIRQFTRDSGKLVRRRTNLFDRSRVVNQTVTPDSYGWPVGPSALYGRPGILRTTTTVREKAWFSAAYTYYIQPTGSLLDIRREYQLFRHLYGIGLTPELLWNLAPWSWLADYVGNTGDVLSNLTAFSHDNLVAKYAYVMFQTETKQSWELSGGKTAQGADIASKADFTTTEKHRAWGNPYGFAVDFNLTLNQAAILGALGLSRLPDR